jgi:hypothetical protein
MPFKHNAARRHRIGKTKFKGTSWAEYEAGLRRRGSLTFNTRSAVILAGAEADDTRRPASLF